MNPQIVLHLSEEQFDELLARSATATDRACAPAEAHLLACEQCAAELETLRESLLLFRTASTAYANDELRRRPQMTLVSRRILSPVMEPAWWVAAVAVLLAGLLPMQLSRHPLHQSSASSSAALAVSSAQSDEALLEDVDRDTSAAVPASMQALADPTAGGTVALDKQSLSTSTQRKD